MSNLISSTGTVSTLSGYSDFPVGNISALTSNFELQKTEVYLNNNDDILKKNKYMAAWRGYTSSQNVEPSSRPSWANHVNIVCVGGGGGGGGGANASSNSKTGGGAGGSGGSGGYISNSNDTPIPLSANETIEITIGGGGTGGSVGNNGGVGGTGGNTIVSMKLANIKMFGYGGTGGNGGTGAGNKNGTGGNGGTGAGMSAARIYGGDTVPIGINFNGWDGTTGNSGNNGSWNDIYNAGGAAVDYKMTSTLAYPDIKTYGRSGAGGRGGRNATGVNNLFGVGFPGTAGTSGYVRIYWLASNNTT